MLQALIGFFTALPQLLNMIQGLMGWITKVSGDDPAGFLVKAGLAFDLLNKAKTEEDYKNAAKALSDLISNMPPK